LVRIRRRSRKTGLPPGSLVYVGEKKVGKPRITIMDYDGERVEEKEVSRVEDCFPFKESPTVTWINIDGIHDVELIERIGRNFDFHPLLLEDILNTQQRPKLEDFGTYLFVVLKMITYGEGVEEEQISIIIAPNFVITFQEGIGDIFDPLRERIREGKGKVRKKGSDYLAYAIIDAVVDNYFSVLESLGEEVEAVEMELIQEPSTETLQAIHDLKRELITLRKSVWPLREVSNTLLRGDSKLVKKENYIYLKDVYDHTIQIMDTIESYRDMVSGMLDIYLSSISNRMNEVMKVLTIIATIFIPLTFLAGIYGMNFAYMPELEWHYGYFAVLVSMLLIASLMVVYFRRKGWM